MGQTNQNLSKGSVSAEGNRYARPKQHGMPAGVQAKRFWYASWQSLAILR